MQYGQRKIRKYNEAVTSMVKQIK